MPEVTGLKPRPGSSYNGSCSVNKLEGNLVLIISSLGLLLLGLQGVQLDNPCNVEIVTEKISLV
jgi:hypothetical protein